MDYGRDPGLFLLSRSPSTVMARLGGLPSGGSHSDATRGATHEHRARLARMDPPDKPADDGGEDGA